jgi:hypothetical protein
MPVATALRVTHWRRESVMLSPGGNENSDELIQFIEPSCHENPGKPEPTIPLVDQSYG